MNLDKLQKIVSKPKYFINKLDEFRQMAKDRI